MLRNLHTVRLVLAAAVILTAAGPWSHRISAGELPLVTENKVKVDGGGLFGAYEASSDYTPPRDPDVIRKLQQWQDLKFGVLLSWGPYSQLGIVESWTLCPEKYDYEGGCRR
jgi:hypothetical protein